MKAFVLLLLLPAFAFSQTANRFAGVVTKVKDGDTFRMRVECGESQFDADVRMVGIDAPESQQAFGDSARRALTRLVLGRPVRVEWEKQDKYGRFLGTAYLSDTVDVNAALVAAGLAWVYSPDDEPLPATDPELLLLEAEARAARVGLCQPREPVAVSPSC